MKNVSQAHQWVSASENPHKKALVNLEKLELLLLQESEIATDGSDLQKVWFKYFIEISQTPQSQNHLSNWLQGNAVPKALVANQDIRWSAIIALSSAGHPATEQLLKLELLRDTSDKGTMMALAANASQPNSDVKQYWLDELMRNEERQTAARLKQAMRYLFPTGQKQLHKVFAEKILTDLHYLDSHRGQTLVEQLVDTILPSLCSKDSVALLAKAQDKMVNLGLIAQKGIRIAHQEDNRCIAINDLMDN